MKETALKISAVHGAASKASVDDAVETLFLKLEHKTGMSREEMREEFSRAFSIASRGDKTSTQASLDAFTSAFDLKDEEVIEYVLPVLQAVRLRVN